MKNKNEHSNQTAKLVTIAQAAAILRVSKNTLRLWDRKGILKAVRYGVRGDRKYLVSDLEALLQKEE